MITEFLTRAWLTNAPPGDPLGPVNQDPDAVREEACKLVSKDTSVCSAPKPPTPPQGKGGGVDLSIVSLLLWALLIAAVIGLLYMVLRSVAKTSGRGRARKKPVVGEDDDDLVERDAVAVDRSREPVNWRTEAEQHRLAGRYRDALRCRYRALVGDLARRGLIDEIPGRTTGEERVQLGRVTPVASTSFNSAADLFDGAWYGHLDVDAADDDHFQVLERDVLATAVQARR
ncbi:MAG TPA: DUF4129 domain-containing protein [Ilumatobacteraceae bacterium]|nr:DUF4129 domain-containing protein [Ilumatobacteraceae bacterium]HRB03712.1 DUF4129 domain-containing protein [Ilumatobacteraceae bacterium]